MMTRDQRRAIFAYERVKEVPPQHREDYRTLVRGLGPLVLRSGLVSALAFLQRRRVDSATKMLFEHLAQAGIPGLDANVEHATEQICERTRTLELEETMLATRELLKVVEWMKRAVEASFDEEA